MDLKEYLFRNNLKTTKFARRIGYQDGYVRRIVNKQGRPSRRLAEAIVRGTEGIVTMDDLDWIKD